MSVRYYMYNQEEPNQRRKNIHKLPLCSGNRHRRATTPKKQISFVLSYGPQTTATESTKQFTCSAYGPSCGPPWRWRLAALSESSPQGYWSCFPSEKMPGIFTPELRLCCSTSSCTSVRLVFEVCAGYADGEFG